MTTTGTKTPRETETTKPAARPEPHRDHRIRREIGILAVNTYERSIAGVAAFEKDAAKIAPYPWMKEALTVSAELIEDVGAAYVKTARQVLR
jgi:hypothetical protein